MTEPTTAKKNNVERSRFIRAAERRTKAVMADLLILESLSNGRWAICKDDIDRIFGVLSAELKRVRISFEDRLPREKFQL